jgi:hypothetical protein
LIVIDVAFVGKDVIVIEVINPALASVAPKVDAEMIALLVPPGLT